MSDRDPGTALLHAIARDAARHGLAFAESSVATVDWASATFLGHRHRIVLSDADAGAATWLARLADVEWTLPGHIVIDVAILDPAPQAIVLAALTIRDL